MKASRAMSRLMKAVEEQNRVLALIADKLGVELAPTEEAQIWEPPPPDDLEDVPLLDDFTEEEDGEESAWGAAQDELYERLKKNHTKAELKERILQEFEIDAQGSKVVLAETLTNLLYEKHNQDVGAIPLP